MTPNSSQTSYASPADIEVRYDPRLMAQLCSIDPSNPIIYDPPTTDTLSTSPILLTALKTGSGALEAACLRAQAYAVTDLQAMNGMALEYMKTIVCSIAMVRIYKFRGGPNIPEGIIEDYNQAMEALNQLSGGDKIFSFSETEQAGLPGNYRMQGQDYVNLNMVTAPGRFGRFMGIRQEYRTPYGGYGGGRCGW